MEDENIPSHPTDGALPDEVVQRLAPFVDPRALRRLRVRAGSPWAWVPRAFGASATTLGHRVLFRDGAYRTTDARGLALIAHEAVHVRQYHEMGWPRFLARYAVGAVRVRFRHNDHELEQEPLRVQAQVRQALTDG